MRRPTRILSITALLLLVAASRAPATTTTTSTSTTSTTTTTTTSTLPTFPTVRQPTTITWGEHDLITGQTCPNGITCETPVFSLMASDTPVLWVDMAGTGRVKLQCRLPGFRHDIEVADSGSLTDAGKVVVLTAPCHWIVAQLSACSGTCKARAHVTERGGTD